ncbi:tetratricopeptide repeat protein, partial [Streptomyces virginiae]|uniref:tetratricopeptide repeat protein n=1 Tax=Streptomyces virginiae TaxID=1961 RepID=UPI0036D1D521
GPQGDTPLRPRLLRNGLDMGFKSRWGTTLLRVGISKAGENTLRRNALSGDRDSAESLAWFLESTGERAQAASVLRSAIAAGAPGLELQLADLLSEQGDASEEAERWYRAALERGLPGAGNNFGCFLSDIGRNLEAESVLQQAVQSRDFLASGNLGKLYFDLGDYESARNWLTQALSGGNYNSLPYLAMVEVELGDSKAAQRHALQAMERGVEGALLAHAVSVAASPDTSPAEICEAFERAQEESAEAHLRYGNWLKSRGKVEEAIAQHEQAISLGEVNSHLNLAVILDDIGRQADAEEHLRLGMAGGDDEAAAALARFLADAGRPEEIPDVIREAERLGHPAVELGKLWHMYDETDQ